MQKISMLLFLALFLMSCQPEEDEFTDLNLTVKTEIQDSKEKNEANRIRVRNIEALRKLPFSNTKNRKEVLLLGYYEPGDGGGGIFYWDPISTEEDNGGTILSIQNNETGRWKREYKDTINVKWFGAKGNGIFDDTEFLKRALDINQNLDLMNGTYKITGIQSKSIKKSQTPTYIFNGTITGEGIFSLENKTYVYLMSISFKGIDAIHLDHSSNVTFYKCAINDMKVNGIVDSSTCEKITVLNSSFKNIGIGSINETYQGMAIILRGKKNKVEGNTIRETFGHGSIWVSGAKEFIIRNNFITDTFFRGIHIYGGKPKGVIESNVIRRCGYINTSDVGVGCNGIFSGTDASEIDIIQNDIRNILENGIEGNFRKIEKNYIENSGADIINFPTPSSEGIYSSGQLITGNIVVNAKGPGIKYYTLGKVENMEITDNIIKGNEETSNFPIYILAKDYYKNIYILRNEFYNFKQGVYISNVPKFNVVILDNIFK